MNSNLKSANRVVIYIDGSNFYFSVKNTFKCKIDIEKFCKKLAGNNKVMKIKYYIAPVDQTSNLQGYVDQQKFFDILKKIDKLEIVFGRLEKRKKGNFLYYVEKASDINLALDLVLDAQKDFYDTAYLVSNDGDFSGAVKSVINFGKKAVYIAIGNRKTISYHLKKVSSFTIRITKDFISDLAI